MKPNVTSPELGPKEILHELLVDKSHGYLNSVLGILLQIANDIHVSAQVFALN